MAQTRAAPRSGRAPPSTNHGDEHRAENIRELARLLRRGDDLRQLARPPPLVGEQRRAPP